MNANRSNAVFTGVLFIVATVAGVVGLGLLSPILDDAGYLSRVSADETQFLVGVCLLLVMAGACAGIAVAMYPVLRKHSEGLALGAVAFRVIEGALHAVAAISLALLLPLGQEFLKAGTPGSSHFQTLGVLLKAGNEWASNSGMLAFCLGALMYYIVFYQTRLVPRWLSGWGIVAIALSIVASILTMVRIDSPTSTLDTVLHLPIFLQEMVLAVWLIAKGFDQTGIACQGGVATARRPEYRAGHVSPMRVGMSAPSFCSSAVWSRSCSFGGRSARSNPALVRPALRQLSSAPRVR